MAGLECVCGEVFRAQCDVEPMQYEAAARLITQYCNLILHENSLVILSHPGHVCDSTKPWYTEFQCKSVIGKFRPIGRLGQSLLIHREFEMGVILSDCNSTRLWTELCMYTV